MNRIRIWVVMSVLVLAGWSLPVWAATLEWDRNVEPDMDKYNVRLCFTTGCTVTMATALAGTTLQTVAGTVPAFTLPNGFEGSAAVSAVDKTGNESGLSVQIPFDAKAPSIPINPRVK